MFSDGYSSPRRAPVILVFILPPHHDPAFAVSLLIRAVEPGSSRGGLERVIL